MRWICALGAVLSMAACAHGREAREHELSRLRRKVQSLERDLADAKDRIRAIDRRLSLTETGPGEPAGAASAPGAPRSSAGAPDGPPPSLPVVRVAPEGGRPVSPEDRDPGALDDGRPPILIKLGPSEPERLSVDTSVLSQPDPVLHARDPKADYERALGALREARDAERAKRLFRTFERRYPESNLADNAAYWRGEAHFSLREFADAIACFRRLINEYPRSSKVPYARLRWGESLLEMSRTRLASKQLRTVLESYPESPAAKDARRLLADLDAKGSM